MGGTCMASMGRGLQMNKILIFLNGEFKDNEGNEFSVRDWLKIYTQEILTAREGDFLNSKYIGEKEPYVAVHMIIAGLIEGTVKDNYSTDYDRGGYIGVMKKLNEMIWSEKNE